MAGREVEAVELVDARHLHCLLGASAWLAAPPQLYRLDSRVPGATRIPRERPADSDPPEDSWRPALLTALVSVFAPILLAIAVTAVAAGGLGWGTLRVGVRSWLIAVGSSIELDDAVIDLIPLGGLSAAAGVAALATRFIAGPHSRDPIVFGAVAGGAAGVLAAVLSAASSTPSVGTSFVRSAFGAFMVVGLAAAATIAVRHRSLPIPDRVRSLLPAVRAGARAAGAVLGIAITLVLVLAAFHVRAAADLWAALNPGFGGGLALAALCLLSFPTLVAWAIAVLFGPGIRLGTDTHVDITGVDVDALPAFPPLAVLPDPGPFPDVVVALMLIPILIAGHAGWRMIGGETPSELWPGIGRGALAGATAGALLGLVAATGHGAIGPGLLADVGPPVLTTWAAAVGSMASGGAIGAALAHYRGTRARPE